MMYENKKPVATEMDAKSPDAHEEPAEILPSEKIENAHASGDGSVHRSDEETTDTDKDNTDY